MTSEMILGFVRHLLTIVGGIMVAKGSISSGVMDAVIGGILSVAGMAWSAVQKVQQAQAEARAEARAATGPSPSTGTTNPGPASRLGLALALLFSVMTLPAFAAEPLKRSQIGAPYSNPDQVPTVVGSFYVGAALGNAFDLSDEWFAGGLAGYKAKLGSNFVVGFEVDATRRFTNIDTEGVREIDQWTFSARPILGYLVLPSLMPYVTAGPAWQGTEFGWTYGGGLELGLTDRGSVRFEVLRFEHDDSTAGRAAYVYRF